MARRARATDAEHGEAGSHDEETGATVVSTHRTSEGIVQYRRWPGGWTVELVDEPPPEVVAWVSGDGESDASGRPNSDRGRPRPVP
jgi:hypothetical protein